ncbi:hypothetical protein I2485_03955 [Nesterenkonia sp. E16_7]|uniref:hypothetical protein n=1 Tax=unclassified Nesterenkonia TaxID=2629769 RepID=UPI001A932B0A|nr:MULTISPECIES: hypothetical protein [unclassified Nesterenkonia]MBO0596335.1 hypothetical protein [Nesterenkonia sp. E16_10]MBO0597799.1 hypothetical protein [Nesterenkonia sp. E16_7]
MEDSTRDEILTQLIDRPQERERILHEARLSGEKTDQLMTLADTADMLWLSAQGAPPLENDPVAALLGLVPNQSCAIDSTALSRVRKRSRMTVSDVAKRLQERGWEFSKSDVLRWEMRTAADVPPAVGQALADILGTEVESLISTASPDTFAPQIAAVRRHPLFENLVNRWAEAMHVSRTVAASALEGRMLTTVHRGERPDTEQLVSSLEALVTSIERADQE